MGLLGLLLKLRSSKMKWKVKDPGYQKLLINGRVYYVRRVLEITRSHIKFIDKDGIVRVVRLVSPLDEGGSISEHSAI